MSYEEALKYIYSRELFGIKLGLNNITGLMASLGNPHKKFKSIHVAGTNGKGSVCAFISSILEKQGYKTGVYTSPHLVDFRERIRINGKKISKKNIVSLLSKIKPFIKDHTYFEIVTALAFTYFAQQKVDFAVVEVGMGGRLDATNIITPEVSIITNISLEHTEHLGNTINKIAFEKAGIIKPNIPVVASKECKGSRVIRDICKKRKCSFYPVKTRKINTSLRGEFQYQNASIALKAIEMLNKKYKISKEAIKTGLKSARWPGRFEHISKNIIFDCAHNAEGAKVLAKEIKKLKCKNVYIILGIMKDKDIDHICKNLEPVAKEIIITKPKIERAAMPKNIAKFIHKKIIIIKNVNDALEYAKMKAKEDDIILLTGSIFTVGEAFSFIRPEPFN
ncbi:MAG: bifunctional folylpolyglutamate synthase/dihydrofolate synthase [Nanoarchaeota archaeon]|nr:bifunctional folylpolyglutamate synthase/dihydrofolate synthase [Nanoarchaeota archaeon]